METSTKIGIGAGVLSLALCCGGASCAGCAGLGTGTTLSALGVSQMQNEPEEAPESKPKPTVTPYADPGDTVAALRRNASGTVRGCTGTEPADLTKALALANLVVTAGKDLLPAPAPTLSIPQCSDATPYKGEYMFGFLALDQKPAVTPAVFEPRNAGCSRAATIYALGLAQQRGDFAVYDGPFMPGLPYEVKDALATFGEVCEKQEAGELTQSGQVFEGTREGAVYTGTVKYSNGAVAKGAFEKDNTGNFSPIGQFEVNLIDGGLLKASTDGVDATEEEARYQAGVWDAITIPGAPDAGDLVWLLDNPDANDTRKTRYTFKSNTGELSIEPEWTDPAGVEMHKIKDAAEMATFTGYGKFTDFPAESPYKGYEGYWENGKFSGGKGTLVLKNGQTIQTNFKDGAPVATDELKLKESEGAATVTLEFLMDNTGWLKWTNKAAGEWDKYTWSTSENKMVVRKMVKP